MGARRSGKLRMLMLSALLVLFCGALNARASTVNETSVDLRSLLDFKAEIKDDPTGALLAWNDSLHYCKWTGVNCSATHPGRVTVLNLLGLNLEGQITPSLGNLTFLRKLILGSNRFSGRFPPLNRLRRLQILALGSNSFQGNIPDALTNCSQLVVLDLSSNNFVGAIPPNIGFLSNLQALDLSANNLTGVIPPSLNNITQLQEISLATNSLGGRIPEGLGQLPSMTMILLGQNNLSGRIPASLFNLSYINTLGLDTNMLSGTLSSNIGDTLPRLQLLLLGANMLEGNIPASLGNVSELARIDLSSNSFVGQVPSSFGNLRKLYYLNLDHNKIEAGDNQSWEFLGAMSNCPLQFLSLYGNQLHGDLPSSVGNLSIMLRHLDLGANHLSGIVPPGIGKYPDLSSLGLSYNNLTGTIEKWIGSLRKLQGLYLEGNNFIGSIPYSIGNLTRLTLLSVSKNQFDGVMPSSLGNFPQLTKLDLSYNNFQGNIPMQVSNLKQLTELRLSSNKITGEIPNNLDRCDNLITIQLDQNMLTGEIPSSLGKLSGLQSLNFSHNNLSGTIPIALSDLQFLRMLDLSYNHLQGQIPRNGVFENPAALLLDGNWGLCGGAPSLHRTSCYHGSQKLKIQYYLVRILIPIFGFMSLVAIIYFILTEKKMRRKNTMLPPFGKQFLKVSYKDLDEATENFSESNLIGRGSYGSVYKGKLSQNKMEVAVKVFDLEMHGAERSFLVECEAVRNIQHRNLLPIITACSTADNNGNAFKALVYEFMPNGNLDSWLHHKGDEKTKEHLNLTKRISIVLDIADVLDYLHNSIGKPIIHCDLKPSNILLDCDMTAYLGDFGIARFILDSRLKSRGDSSSVGLRGTIGYIAPGIDVLLLAIYLVSVFKKELFNFSWYY